MFRYELNRTLGLIGLGLGKNKCRRSYVSIHFIGGYNLVSTRWDHLGWFSI
jgi:hypothetical protein